VNVPAAPQNLDYLGHLARNSARFAQVLARAPAGMRVPTCPGWDADDLLWHLAQVQWFWGTIVGNGLRTQAEVESLERPSRPGRREELAAHFDRASGDLQHNLSTTSPGTPAWTWSEQQSVGFILRRQAHEALIHRLDAELTMGQRTPMDADISADGIDEALGFMGSAVPLRGRFLPEPAMTIQVRTSEQHRSWLVTLGRLSGTQGDSNQHNEPALQVAALGFGTPAADEPAAATIDGGAADLDCLLWNRPAAGRVQWAGDRVVRGRLEQIIADNGH
jgi:uncharacterized protein (TIGR03083 family)